MARLPGRLPRWHDTIYGGDEDAWEEAKAQCLRTLRACAGKRDLCSYGELASSVEAIAWPDGPHTHEGNQMGYLLGQVSLEQLDIETDRPLISALVVEKDSQRPSHGFWAMCRELGLADAVSTESRREGFCCARSIGAGTSTERAEMRRGAGEPHEIAVHAMSRDEDREVDPAEVLDALAAQVASMMQRGRHTLDLIQGVPSSKEGRRLGTEIRGLVADLRGTKRDVDTLRRGLRAAKTPAAHGAVVGQLGVRFTAIQRCSCGRTRLSTQRRAPSPAARQPWSVRELPTIAPRTLVDPPRHADGPALLRTGSTCR